MKRSMLGLVMVLGVTLARAAPRSGLYAGDTSFAQVSAIFADSAVRKAADDEIISGLYRWTLPGENGTNGLLGHYIVKVDSPDIPVSRCLFVTVQLQQGWGRSLSVSYVKVHPKGSCREYFAFVKGDAENSLAGYTDGVEPKRGAIVEKFNQIFSDLGK